MKLKDYIKVICNNTPIILRVEKDRHTDAPNRSIRLFEAYKDSPVFRFYDDREVLEVEASDNKIDILIAK